MLAPVILHTQTTVKYYGSKLGNEFANPPLPYCGNIGNTTPPQPPPPLLSAPLPLPAPPLGAGGGAGNRGASCPAAGGSSAPRQVSAAVLAPVRGPLCAPRPCPPFPIRIPCAGGRARAAPRPAPRVCGGAGCGAPPPWSARIPPRGRARVGAGPLPAPAFAWRPPCRPARPLAALRPVARRGLALRRGGGVRRVGAGRPPAPSRSPAVGRPPVPFAPPPLSAAFGAPRGGKVTAGRSGVRCRVGRPFEVIG